MRSNVIGRASCAGYLNAAVRSLPLPRKIGRNRGTGKLKERLSPGSGNRFDWMIRHNPRMKSSTTQMLSDPEALLRSIFQADRIGALPAR